jgi:hypothetical protein
MLPMLTADFLYTDQIQFDSGQNLQKCRISYLIQDAASYILKRFADGTKETLPIENEIIEGFS